MKTEFLEGLGLEKDAIDKIMAENGKDVEAEKAKTKAAVADRDRYKDQLDTATGELDKFKDVKPDELQQTIADLQKQLKDKDDEYAAREADRAFHESVSAAIKDALQELQKDSDYLFGSKEPIQNPTGPTNSSHSEGEDSALRAAMGLPPVKD